VGTSTATATIVNDDANTPPAANLTEVYAGQVSVTMSSVVGGYVGSRSVDNSVTSFSATANGADEWYKLDLGATHDLDSIVLTNRNVDGSRLNGSVVKLLDAAGNTVHSFAAIAGATNGQVLRFDVPDGINARSVYIDGAPNQYLQVAEIDVFGAV
jgi:F5/8 type C domain